MTHSNVTLPGGKKTWLVFLVASFVCAAWLSGGSATHRVLPRHATQSEFVRWDSPDYLSIIAFVSSAFPRTASDVPHYEIAGNPSAVMPAIGPGNPAQGSLARAHSVRPFVRALNGRRGSIVHSSSDDPLAA